MVWKLKKLNGHFGIRKRFANRKCKYRQFDGFHSSTQKSGMREIRFFFGFFLVFFGKSGLPNLIYKPDLQTWFLSCRMGLNLAIERVAMTTFFWGENYNQRSLCSIQIRDSSRWPFYGRRRLPSIKNRPEHSIKFSKKGGAKICLWKWPMDRTKQWHDQGIIGTTPNTHEVTIN